MGTQGLTSFPFYQSRLHVFINEMICKEMQSTTVGSEAIRFASFLDPLLPKIKFLKSSCQQQRDDVPIKNFFLCRDTFSSLFY
jgi:hypothetical protein